MAAFKFMFAAYYIFNLCYPKQLSHTLEFVQRYFLKLNPEQGTKSKKGTISKIISLLTKLRQMK